jgi:hypothetical protein
MSPKLQEALQFNPSLGELDVDGLLDAAAVTEVLPRPARKSILEYRDHIHDNFNLIVERFGTEIGRANVESWDDEVEEKTVRVATIEDISLLDSQNYHSAYLALLRQVAGMEEETSLIEGAPINEMTAVTLDLDTFNLLPEGWRARYFQREGGKLVELQYPLEVFDHIKEGELVYHFLERTPEN